MMIILAVLFLNVQKIVDMNFDDLPIKFYDIPTDQEYCYSS